MASILKKTGTTLSVAGVLWFCYVIGERYHDPVPEISPVFCGDGFGGCLRRLARRLTWRGLPTLASHRGQHT